MENAGFNAMYLPMSLTSYPVALAFSKTAHMYNFVEFVFYLPSNGRSAFLHSFPFRIIFTLAVILNYRQLVFSTDFIRLCLHNPICLAAASEFLFIYKGNGVQTKMVVNMLVIKMLSCPTYFDIATTVKPILISRLACECLSWCRVSFLTLAASEPLFISW